MSQNETPGSFGGHSMVAPLRTVAVKRPIEAFQSTGSIREQWEDLDYLRPPDLDRATRDHEQFVELLESLGATVRTLPVDTRTGMDSLYTHDPVLITDAGLIIFKTGKPARRGEGPAFADVAAAWGVPILGTVQGEGTAEGGDMVWLDSRTLVAGRGFRTTEAGIEAIAGLLSPLGVTVVSVQLPYWNGRQEVLHLQSFLSLVDDDLAVVFRRMLPVPLFELLEGRGVEFVDVPDEEYDSMGCNVLTVAPRNVVMVAGNPVTRSRLEAAGCTVSEFDGSEICIPGAGGPTCLTRPLWRD